MHQHEMQKLCILMYLKVSLRVKDKIYRLTLGVKLNQNIGCVNGCAFKERFFV